METIEQLLIRACKSYNPKVRLVSVLRRFYVGDADINDNHTIAGLINHLSYIVDEYCPMKTIDIIAKLEEDYSWLSKHKDERTFREKALDMLISRICCTKASNFIGLRTPRWFK